VADVNSNNFTIGFAIVSCVAASFLLSSASLGLKDIQDSNVKTDKQRSVLLAAGLIGDSASKEEIAVWFESSDGNAAITPKIIDEKTGETDADIDLDSYIKKPAKFPGKSLVYECSKPGSESIILPIAGQGLWGPLKGYIALADDGNSVLGICFYYHQETPGLGAEITEGWYTDQFAKESGKKILKTPGNYSKDSFVGISSLKSLKVTEIEEAKQPYHIDGISGATITSVGVTEALTNTLYEQYSAYLKNRKS
jgi:Na+-transporting NADH:ubiquinone oxidoreductase subunit C